MITRDDVIRTAKLAHLRLSDAEIDGATHELLGIVAHVELLLSADVAVQTHAPSSAAAALRADVAGAVLGRDALAASVGFDGVVVHVPKVID